MSGGPEEWNKEKVVGQTPNPESIKPESTEPEYKNLKNFSPDKIKNTIKSIDFGIKSTQKNEKLISQLNQNAEGNNSIEGELARNEQVQLLLSEILFDYNNYIGTDKEQLKAMIQQEKLQIPEEQSQMIESMYEYMLTNDNLKGFEDFIKSNGIYVIKTYFSNAPVDNNDGKLTFYSKNEIKARLKISWFINLYKGYREKHVESSDALTKLEQELRQFNDVASFLKNSIDEGINQYLGGKFGKDELAQYLNEFLISAKENEKLKSLIHGKDKNSIIGVIRYGIKEYARLLNISDANPQLRKSPDGDKVFDMQIRSYLYLYGLIVYPDKFDSKKGLDEKELGRVLKGILVNEGVIKDDGEDKDGYVKYERGLRENQIKQDITRRKETWTRIQSMKNKNLSSESQLGNKEKGKVANDINVATGVEIAGELGLGRKIKIKRKEFGDVLENPLLKRNVLKKTGKDFVGENLEILSRYFNISEISGFFDIGKNGINFNNKAWEIFKNKWIAEHPGSNINELDIVRLKLLEFPAKYKENLANVGDLVNEKMDNAHETVKNYAIGAIIDNIKDMFQNIIDTNSSLNFMTGFEFNGEKPAKIKGDCLLLRGKFNGEIMNIKYNINTGKLYMNSFINETSGRIIIRGSTKPCYELGELRPFKDILDEFYKTPTESMNSNTLNLLPRIRNRYNTKKSVDNTGGKQNDESKLTPQTPVSKISETRNKIREEHKLMFQKMCGTKLDEISGKIKDKIESKSIREPVAMNLLRSFGIMPGVDSTKNISGGSDLYRVIQLIITSDNTKEDINNFSEYMKTFMDNIGLTRGENKSHQDKTGDIARIIFDKNNNQNTIKYVRNNTKNFDNDYSSANGKAQFDEKSNFGILKIIEENFTEGEYPNQKLSTKNINGFKNSLSRDISDVRDVAKAEDLISMDNLDKYYT